MVLTIPEMHQHLDSLNHFFSQKTSAFISLITSHPGRLTPDDLSQFADLIEEIRNDALSRISEFFNIKLSTKCELYDLEVLLSRYRSLHTLTQDNLSKNS
jgi:hypothetical protein